MGNAETWLKSARFFRYPPGAIENQFDLTTAKNLELTRCIFAAKEVPLALIAEIPAQKEFHLQDWDSVMVSDGGSLKI